MSCWHSLVTLPTFSNPHKNTFIEKFLDHPQENIRAFVLDYNLFHYYLLELYNIICWFKRLKLILHWELHILKIEGTFLIVCYRFVCWTFYIMLHKAGPWIVLESGDCCCNNIRHSWQGQLLGWVEGRCEGPHENCPGIEWWERFSGGLLCPANIEEEDMNWNETRVKKQL